MDPRSLKDLLEQVQKGTLSTEDAAAFRESRRPFLLYR